MEKFYGIQYLRGAAATFVILYHSMVMVAVAPFFSKPIGDFGVDIFFVISGFVMWVTTESRDKSIFSFWLSRIIRVAPLYWLFTLVIVVAAVLVPSLFFNSRGIEPDFLIKSLLFIPAHNPDVGDITPVYTIGWTLVYEMFFYALFGVSLLLRNPKHRLVLIAILLCSLALLGVALSPEGALGKTYTSPIILEFLFGVLVGYTRSYWAGLGKSATAIFVLGSIAALVAVDADLSQRAFSYGLPALFLVGGFVSLEKYVRLRLSKIALLFGEASYSLYLSHPISQRIWYVMFVAVFGQVATMQLAIGYAAGSVVAGLFGGLICYLVVEKFLLKVARTITPGRLKTGAPIEG
ncbi:acyltransferase family protein [Pseudomonas plecoglossicida]|uniref:acyltransferase family protein n=1 Tax=Pseudomonas plecoglossicida TaxID=70775 RepID=UPI0005A11A08|nr:acyltransferase [Pseudomonas plecoglossicida]